MLLETSRHKTDLFILLQSPLATSPKMKPNMSKKYYDKFYVLIYACTDMATLSQKFRLLLTFSLLLFHILLGHSYKGISSNVQYCLNNFFTYHPFQVIWIKTIY